MTAGPILDAPILDAPVLDIPVLDVRDLRVVLRDPGETAVLHGLSFHVGRGETLAVVGESGCGKSVASLAVMGLLPPALRRAGGRILLDGEDLASFPPRAMRAVRGARIGMVFQEPMTTLNPSLTVGAQIAEVLREHEPLSRRAAARRTVELLDQVRLPDPARLARAFPHRLSGGQRQRVVIAAAVACRPALIIADEPTTALDVTVQAQVLELLATLKREIGSALLLITHNLGVVAQVADRVMVLYAGRQVEEAPVRALFAAPCHPYTRGLMAATPNPPAGPTPPPLDGPVLREIPGLVASLHERTPGCPFEPRCDRSQPHCRAARPLLTPTPGGGRAACFVEAGSLPA